MTQRKPGPAVVVELVDGPGIAIELGILEQADAMDLPAKTGGLTNKCHGPILAEVRDEPAAEVVDVFVVERLDDSNRFPSVFVVKQDLVAAVPVIEVVDRNT